MPNDLIISDRLNHRKRFMDDPGKMIVLLLSIILLSACRPDKSDKSFEPVSFSKVTITDHFWSLKMDTNRINGIPGCFSACNYALVNFDIISGTSDARREGTLASDSDVYKIIQGVAHALDHSPDPNLKAFTDTLIDRIAVAQEPDGYLNTYFSGLAVKRTGNGSLPFAAVPYYSWCNRGPNAMREWW